MSFAQCLDKAKAQIHTAPGRLGDSEGFQLASTKLGVLVGFIESGI